MKPEEGKAVEVVNELMGKLEDDKGKYTEERQELDKRVFDPMIGLRETVAGYITERFENLSKEKDFADQIREKLLERLPEAKFSELMSLFNNQKIRETEAVGSLLEFFKPSHGDKPTLIGEAKSDNTSSPEERVFAEANADSLQAIQKLTEIVATVVKNKTEDS